MSAAERLAALDDLPARELIGATAETLRQLVAAMNEETTLLRAGRHRQCAEVSAKKTRLAQDYVGYSRAVQRQMVRLDAEASNELRALRAGHEQLATQMAENLRVIATARMVTEDLLTDVAQRMAQATRPNTYGAAGQLNTAPANYGGLAVNRAL